MIKAFCNVCQQECNDPKFFCEILARRVRQIALNAKMEVQENMQEARFHLCQKCFDEKLPELT